MRNVLRLFVGDLKRAVSNTVTFVVLFGLVAIPSIFSWYNMLAAWNVFDNTGNLTVAVANTDEGYQSDLIPIRVNVGDRVVEALRANKQLNWVFTDSEDAIDGARSGRYYAAVVIPGDFSQRMMTFYAPDSGNATIVYYSNEKKSAIAPKITDQGADRMSTQVNSVFIEAISEVALGLASGLSDYADSVDVEGRVDDLAGHLDRVSFTIDDAGKVLGMYASVLESTQSLADDSRALMSDSADALANASGLVGEAGASARNVAGEISDAAAKLEDTAGSQAGSLSRLPEALDDAFTTVDDAASVSAGQLRERASKADEIAQEDAQLITQLENVRNALRGQTRIGEEVIADLDAAIARLSSAKTLLERLAFSLRGAADTLESGSAQMDAARAEVQGVARQAAGEFESAQANYERDLVPVLEELAASLRETADSIDASVPAVRQALSDAQASVDSLEGEVTAAREKLASAESSLNGAASDLRDLAGKLRSAVASGDSQQLRDLLRSDPATLASALAAPVKVDRQAVYPVENFGSAMAPLYTTLALWIGALLIMVTLRVFPSSRTLEELDNPTPFQVFWGRFGIVAVLAVLQGAVVALGNIFFLRVQVQEPLLYLLCFCVSSLVFAFIIYAMVASFGNLGKGIGVLLLVVQVTGGGGSFPLVLLPQFVQDMSPYLPIAHVVNAMRAAMFGLYQGDFWTEMRILLLFTIPFLILGFLRGPLIKVTHWFMSKVESSKLM